MKVLIIGASGYIGSATARSLAEAGHQVLGFARNARNEAWLRQHGYGIVAGDLNDIDGLDDALDDIDGIVFTPRMTFAEESECLDALLKKIEGTGKALVYVTGTGVMMREATAGQWQEATFAEDESFTPIPWLANRVDAENHVLAAAERGVRSMVVRPSHVWGHGGSMVFRAMMGSIRKTGAACYLGHGLHLQAHVHVDDVGELIALAVVKGRPGEIYHAVNGEVNHRFIAQVAGEVASCPARSVTLSEAKEIWGEVAAVSIFGCSLRARSAITRERLGWEPRHGDLTLDLRDGGYLECEEDLALDANAQARMGVVSPNA